MGRIVKDYRLAKNDRNSVLEYWSDYGEFAYETGLNGGDSEHHAGTPFSLQVSLKPGTGLMVLEKDEHAVEQLSRCMAQAIKGYGLESVLHNAEADIEPFMRHLRKHEIKKLPFRDSMVECYNFGNHYRQGLKPLSYRLLGRRRQSWEEVVGGASKEALKSWLYEAWKFTEENWRQEIPQISAKTGKPIKPLLVKSDAEGELKHVLRYVSDSVTYQPWEKMQEFGWFGSDWFQVIQDVVGPVPMKGIGNCDLQSAMEYGCADADDALCLALRFEQMRQEYAANWGVEQEDWDVRQQERT